MTFTAKSGITLYGAVPAEHHDLVRAVVANNYVAMANSAWKNKQLREKLEDRVCKEISSQCTTLNSSQLSPFKLDNNESLKRATPGEQEAELNRKVQLLLKCLKSTACDHKSLASAYVTLEIRGLFHSSCRINYWPLVNLYFHCCYYIIYLVHSLYSFINTY